MSCPLLKAMQAGFDPDSLILAEMFTGKALDMEESSGWDDFFTLIGY